MVTRCNECGDKPHAQDELHGKGQRVHNRMLDPTKARCTRCGNTKNVSMKETTNATGQ